MTTREFLSNEFVMISREKSYSFLEGFLLRKAHPRKIFFDAVALIWAVYFIWNHDWQRALVTSVFIGSLGLMTVWNVDLDNMAKTPLGRLSLVHLHPFNFTLQCIGVPIAVYGLWLHSPEIILSGLSVILIGHIFGWSKFDARLTVTDSRVL